MHLFPKMFSHLDVLSARGRLAAHLRPTPVFTSQRMDELLGGGMPCNLFFKAEHLQKTGSFKARGALNKVLKFREEGQDVKGVITHSSGNHGQALAWAASLVGVPCAVIAPTSSPQSKLDAIRAYGATLHLCPPTMEARQRTCDEFKHKTGYLEVNPHNEYDIMAGQGTMAIELLEQVEGLDAILVPIGGGGMASGIATWVKHAKPSVRVYCVEPKGKELEPFLTSGEYPASKNGYLTTVADGIRVQRVGDKCFPILVEHCEKEVLSCEESDVIDKMLLSWKMLKQTIEPSSACAVAAAYSPRFRQLAAKHKLRNVAVILCGGNVDLDHLPWQTAVSNK